MKTVKCYALTRTYFYKGHLVKRELIMLDLQLQKCINFIDKYEDEVKKHSDPYFGKDSDIERFGHRRPLYLKVWIKGGKKQIVCKINKIYITA